MRLYPSTFEQVKDGGEFRFENSEFSPLQKKIGAWANRAGDDIKVKVRPDYLVYVTKEQASNE